MKKSIILGLLVAVVVVGLSFTTTSAANPWDEIRALVASLQGQVAQLFARTNDLATKDIDLQNQITNIQLIPGPQGEQGPQGIKGDKGDQGIPGSPSWDEARIAQLENRISQLEQELNPPPLPPPPPLSQSETNGGHLSYVECSTWTSCVTDASSNRSINHIAYHTIVSGNSTPNLGLVRGFSYFDLTGTNTSKIIAATITMDGAVVQNTSDSIARIYSFSPVNPSNVSESDYGAVGSVALSDGIDGNDFNGSKTFTLNDAGINYLREGHGTFVYRSDADVNLIEPIGDGFGYNASNVVLHLTFGS